MTKTQLFLVTAVLSLALFLRLYKLNHYPPGLSPDAAFYGLDAAGILIQKHPEIFLSVPWGKEGMIADVMALAFGLFGRLAWSIKLVTVIYGVGGVLGTLLLGKVLDSFRVGWWAAFFMAGSFWHLYLSRLGVNPVLMSAHLTLALFLLLKAAGKNKISLAFWAGVVFGLGFYSYGPYRVTILIILLSFWLARPARKIAVKFFLGMGLVLLPIALFLIKTPAVYLERAAMVINWPLSFQDFFNNFFLSLGLFLPGETPVQTYGLYHQSLIWGPLIWLAILGLVSGLICLERRRLTIFLSGWIFLGLLVATATNEPPSFTRTEFLLPALFFLSALGLEQITNKFPLVKVIAWGWLLFLPLFSWQQLLEVSATPWAEEMFAVRQVKAAQIINRSNLPARVYLVKIPVPGGYAQHFSDAVIEFLVYPRETLSVFPPDLKTVKFEPPFFVVRPVYPDEFFNYLKVSYPQRQLVSQSANGYLGQTEVYLITQ